MGRTPPEKSIKLAIEIADAAHMPLRTAAKIFEEDRSYFHQVIEPLLARSPYAEFFGELSGSRNAMRRLRKGGATMRVD